MQNQFLRKKGMHLLRARLIQVLVHASSGPRPSDKGRGGGGAVSKKSVFALSGLSLV